MLNWCSNGDQHHRNQMLSLHSPRTCLFKDHCSSHPSLTGSRSLYVPSLLSWSPSYLPHSPDHLRSNAGSVTIFKSPSRRCWDLYSRSTEAWIHDKLSYFMVPLWNVPFSMLCFSNEGKKKWKHNSNFAATLLSSLIRVLLKPPHSMLHPPPVSMKIWPSPHCSCTCVLQVQLVIISQLDSCPTVVQRTVPLIPDEALILQNVTLSPHPVRGVTSFFQDVMLSSPHTPGPTGKKQAPHDTQIWGIRK